MDHDLTRFNSGIRLTKLDKIYHEKGDLYHGMKASDDSFESFGEAYFTTIHRGDVKGWKKHLSMTLNLIVPVGEVLFCIYDEHLNRFYEYKIGEDNYCRLTVCPGLWVAFQGSGESLNLILNIGSIEHDPLESINVALETFPSGRRLEN